MTAAQDANTPYDLPQQLTGTGIRSVLAQSARLEYDIQPLLLLLLLQIS
jgi:hypothetical protein